MKIPAIAHARPVVFVPIRVVSPGFHGFGGGRSEKGQERQM